jgi:signal transduction histidine kinase
MDIPPIYAVAGKWMDETFLRRLAADTGVAQSLLLADGTRMASSLGQGTLTVPRSVVTVASDGQRLLDMDGKQFYTRLIPLWTQGDRAPLLIEVALPVDDLVVARNRALTVLALSTGIVALVGTFLGIWAVRRMSDPLEQLTHTAQAISAGDLAIPIPMLHGPREVRTLAAALRRSQASMLTALEDLAHARDWLDNLLQSIVEGVVIFDRKGHITFLNEKAAELAEISVDDALGHHIDSLFLATDESGSRLSMQHLALGGRHRISLARISEPGVRSLRRPGQPTLRRLGATPAPTQHPAMLEIAVTRLAAQTPKAGMGGPLPQAEAPVVEPQTALVLRDISQEESLRHLRSYFLANITHEFRTPLSTWNASMELLLNEADLSASEMRELLKPLHFSLLTLQTLIENLLESSTIEAGRFVLRRQQVDLDQVIAAAVRIVQPLLERRRQTLTRIEPAFLPTLSGDPARLTQVLVNLLSNASKYSPPGSTVTLEIVRRNDRLRAAVVDQGPGIPPAERENLFQRFVRLNTDITEQYGIGLGLYVVKTTVEAHGGSLGVDEHAGGGSVFWFELPTAQAEAVAPLSNVGGNV